MFLAYSFTTYLSSSDGKSICGTLSKANYTREKKSTLVRAKKERLSRIFHLKNNRNKQALHI
jgi:hypothetical protein